MKRLVLRAASLLACSLVCAAGAAAASYPDKVVKIIVPFPAGGGIDLVARVVAKGLSEDLGQQFIVDNRPGFAGNLGTEVVAKAPPDGYTLLIAGPGSTSFAKALFPTLRYDPIKDLAPVTMLVTMPYILVAPPNSPYHTTKDVIDASRKAPGKANIASAGSGTLQQMTGELFKLKAGIEMATIAYKGTTPALADVAGGTVDLLFSDPAGLGLVKGGKVKALGVTGKQRYAMLPDVPTISESGLPGFEATTWYPLMAPAHTPPEIVNLLHERVQRLLQRPEVSKVLIDAGFIPTPMTPPELSAFIGEENKRWSQVIKAANITAN